MEEEEIVPPQPHLSPLGLVDMSREWGGWTEACVGLSGQPALLHFQ